MNYIWQKEYKNLNNLKTDDEKKNQLFSAPFQNEWWPRKFATSFTEIRIKMTEHEDNKICTGLIISKEAILVRTFKFKETIRKFECLRI